MKREASEVLPQPGVQQDLASMADDASTAQLAQAVQIADKDGTRRAEPTSVAESSIVSVSSRQLDEESHDRFEEDEDEVRAATATSTLSKEPPTATSRSPSVRIKSLSPAPESWSTPGPQLSSAALAALAGSLPSTPPPPPVRPPKSAARQRTLSVHSSSGAAAVAAATLSDDLAANRDQPAASHSEGKSPIMESSATTTTTTPTLGGGALSQSRPRPQLSTSATTTTARMSTASSSAGSSPFPSGRRSGAFYTDESDWTGGGGGPSSASIAALETPATTVNFGASPSSSPAAAVDSSCHPSRPLYVETATPPSAELAGLGLDFLATKLILPALDSEAAAARTSFDYDDLDRGVERISQFAKTLPSPVPTVPAQSHFVGGPPKMTMTTTSGGASEPSSPAVSPAERTLPLPRLGMSTISTASPPPQQDSSLERLTSPAPSLHGRLAAFESETDFFSTDVQTDADADGDGDGDGDYDEREDSFNLYPNGLDGRRRRRRERSASSSWGETPSLRFQGPSPQLELDSFALLAAGKNGGGGSTGLWNEDVPNWEGALPRPGDGVVDWTECRLQRQVLPSSEFGVGVGGFLVHCAGLQLITRIFTDTTHLILTRCQTPLQISPLLTTSISSLCQTLVVLDIGCASIVPIQVWEHRLTQSPPQVLRTDRDSDCDRRLLFPRRARHSRQSPRDRRPADVSRHPSGPARPPRRRLQHRLPARLARATHSASHAHAAEQSPADPSDLDLAPKCARAAHDRWEPFPLANPQPRSPALAALSHSSGRCRTASSAQQSATLALGLVAAGCASPYRVFSGVDESLHPRSARDVRRGFATARVTDHVSVRSWISRPR